MNMNDFEERKFQIEALSGGKNTLILDNQNLPSVMVKIPKFKSSDVITGGREETHPAFIIDGQEKEFIYISKYQNVVINQRAYSLPNKDPAVLFTYDECMEFCANKGDRWHLMTNAEWAAIALWSKKNNSMPHGNNSWGNDYLHTHEHGVILTKGYEIAAGESEPPIRVATGSGPSSWSHDGTSMGIYDLNGNVWEYVAGLRLVQSEINIIKNNDAALMIDMSTDSKSWRAIGKGGNLVSPGDSNTLVISNSMDSTENAVISEASIATNAKDMEILGSFKDVLTNVSDKQKDVLNELALAPDNYEDQDGFYAKYDTELLPIRGGYWANGDKAGLFACLYYMSRDNRYFDIGFRSCYYE